MTLRCALWFSSALTWVRRALCLPRQRPPPASPLGAHTRRRGGSGAGLGPLYRPGGWGGEGTRALCGLNVFLCNFEWPFHPEVNGFVLLVVVT